MTAAPSRLPESSATEPADGAAPLPPARSLAVSRDVGDLVVGTALIAMAGWFFVTAGRLDDFSGEGVGASDFPQGIAALLGLGVAVLCFGAVRHLASGEASHVVRIRRVGHVGVGMVLLVAFPPLMSGLGYYPAMTAWLAAFLILCGVRAPVMLVACVAGFLLFTKIVFEVVLGTPLP